jgi:hypothetical protein
MSLSTAINSGGKRKASPSLGNLTLGKGCDMVSSQFEAPAIIRGEREDVSWSITTTGSEIEGKLSRSKVLAMGRLVDDLLV